MKRNIIIGALAVGIAGIASYFFLKRRTSDNEDLSQVNKKPRHLTQAFSKAKQHAIQHS